MENERTAPTEIMEQQPQPQQPQQQLVPIKIKGRGTHHLQLPNGIILTLDEYYWPVDTIWVFFLLYTIRFRCITAYPPNSEYELELRVGDVVYVHKKRDDGWYKGTLQRTGKTGLFPASFVDAC